MILLLIVCVFTQQPKIYAGQIHFSRIPVEYWQHRISMIKSMGLNALSVYVMWNHHESEADTYDFSTQNKNISYFLQIATKLNMSVLLRPGPYVCAEWDFGGIPYWIIKDKQDIVRTTDTYFIERTKIYFTKLAKQIKPYVTNGGIIKYIQIQNEYGSFGNDLNYMQAILDIWKDLIGDFNYYHADGYAYLQRAHLNGLSIGINGGPTQSDYINAKSKFPDAPFIFGGEIYPGWLTHWGEKSFQHQDKSYTLQIFNFFIKTNRSFSMYMAHGGTNFGFTNGVNSPVGVDVTSYDYNAPINQHGKNTDKYDALRNMFKEVVEWDVPDVPANIPIAALPDIQVKKYSTFNNFGQWVKLPFNHNRISKRQIDQIQINQYFGNWSLEQNGVRHGLIGYKFIAPIGSNSMQIQFTDYAYVIIGQSKKSYNTASEGRIVNQSFICRQVCTVQIYVQSLSHINYDRNMLNQRKGLLKIKTSFNITSFQMKKIALYDKQINQLKSDSSTLSLGYFFKGEFTLSQSQRTDTYIDMSRYNKGILWVNGRNLGRFWNIGPQYRLYCPRVWLKEENQIVVLDFQNNVEGLIKSTDYLEGPPL